MPYIQVDVDVSLDDFSDDDILDEYEARGLGEVQDNVADMEQLTKAWLADREGRKDEAYALLREYMLEKLNKVV